MDLLVNLTTPACPLKGQIEADIRRALAPLGAEEVRVRFGGGVRPPERYALPGVKHVVAVASGKGGVGKSTVAANLALALSREGAKVGLLDADLYGPSQAKMFGLEGMRLKVDQDRRILPLEAHGIKVLSIANIVPPGQALAWRGPILHGTLKQFLQDVNWGSWTTWWWTFPRGRGTCSSAFPSSPRSRAGSSSPRPRRWPSLTPSGRRTCSGSSRSRSSASWRT